MTSDVSDPALEGTPSYYGWRVLVASVVGLALSPGPLIVVLLGAIADHLASEFSIGRGQVMATMTAFSIAVIAAALPCGRLIDRLGARRVLIVSTLLMSASLVAIAVAAHDVVTFYALAAVYGFVSIGAQSITFNKLLCAWFERKRGTAMGIAAAGLGLGYSILPLMIAGFLHLTSWRGAFVMLAGTLVVPLILELAFCRPPAIRTLPRGNVSTASPAGYTTRQALGTVTFWTIGLSILLISIVSIGIIPNLVGFSKDLGFASGKVAVAGTVFGLGTLLGRLIVGFCFDRFFAPRVAATCFILSASGFALLALIAHRDLGDTYIVPAVALIGLGFAAESDVIGFLTSRYFGYRAFGQIYSLLFSIFVVAVAIGPVAFGVGRDLAHSYDLTFGIACLVALAAGATMLLMPAYPDSFDLAAEPVGLSAGAEAAS